METHKSDSHKRVLNEKQVQRQSNKSQVLYINEVFS